MSRHSWITAFIGRALRQGRETDPDSVYDEANGRYLEMRELNPEFAADSAFGTLAGDDAQARGLLALPPAHAGVNRR